MVALGAETAVTTEDGLTAAAPNQEQARSP